LGAKVVNAAQYLRMSTEHQQYSLANQADTIKAYALENEFDVIQTYTDAAKSGVTLRNRTGLQQLLEDVVGGKAQYNAVLVYDVSRWGRFQDADEAAHYEFLCKSAGIPIVYCSESFSNQAGLTNALMKALKRTMAGEYSRELSVKVRQGHERLARMGFKQGGSPGYGLRRMLIPSDSRPRRLLQPGERKGLNDRVILVPGPQEEVEVVREIFRLFVVDRKSMTEIPRLLNAKGIPYLNGGKWDHQDMYRMLSAPKYAGRHVYGRSTESLGKKKTFLPSAEWIVKPNAFEPIVDQDTFDKAQRIIASWTINKSNDQILEDFRELLRTEGHLTAGLIEASRIVPCGSTLFHRFGGLLNVYKAIGYERSTHYYNPELLGATRAARDEFIDAVAKRFPHDVTVIPPPKNGRRRGLAIRSLGATLSVVVCRHTRTVVARESRWVLCRRRDELNRVTLVVRMAEENQSVKDIHVLPPLRHARGLQMLSEDHRLLRSSRKLHRLGDLVRIVKKMLDQGYVDRATPEPALVSRT
jgi:DNA invertase Pin-like site-specific DNA recombinase